MLSMQASPADTKFFLPDTLNRIRARSVRLVEAELSELRYGGDRAVMLGSECFPCGPDAWAAWCRFLALPPEMLPHLGRGLGNIVVRCLRNRGWPATDVPDSVRLACNADGVVVGLAPARLAAVSNDDVVRAIQEALPAHVTSETVCAASYDVTDAEFEVSFYAEQVRAEPRPGDVIAGGVTIRHAQAGTSPTVVLAFLHRLVCRNGMTQRVCLHGGASRTRRGKADRTPQRTLDAIRRQIVEAWAQVMDRLQGLSTLLDHSLQVDAFPEFLRRRWSINRTVAAEIGNALAQDELGRTYTEYDIVSAISRVATHSTHLAARYRRHLQLAAGMFAQHHTPNCPLCGAAVNLTPLSADRQPDAAEQELVAL